MRWMSVACAGQVDAFPVSVPDREALVECVARSRFVGLYEGVLLAKVGSLGVVVVDGRLRSRWFDAPRRVLWRESVIPGPPYRLLPSRMAGAGFGSCMRGGASSLQCRWPAVVGRARVCRLGWGGAVLVVHEGVFLVSARCGSGPWGALHALHEGAAEGTEDFVHKGRVCRLGLSLSADGGLRLLAQPQRPDLVDREDGAQVGRSGSLCRPLAVMDVAAHTLVCGQRRRAHAQRQ